MDRFDVWDGTRPVSERVVIRRRQFSTDGMSAALCTENIESPTDWCFEESHHTLVVHLAGQLRRMESTFSTAPSSNALPRVGDIWAIPAGCRYAALAHGDEVRFAEFSLPAGVTGMGDLTARVGHRDAFLYHAAAKLSELAMRDDDLARMASDSLLQVLRFHIEDTYLRGARGPQKANPEGPRRFSERETQILTERIVGAMHDPLTVEELASLVDMSVASLIKGFRVSFGTTPWQYVLKMRLAKAMQLLKVSEASVTEIATLTGFSSPSHFATAFLKAFGLTPSAYRRRK